MFGIFPNVYSPLMERFLFYTVVTLINNIMNFTPIFKKIREVKHFVNTFWKGTIYKLSSVGIYVWHHIPTINNIRLESKPGQINYWKISH